MKVSEQKCRRRNSPWKVYAQDCETLPTGFVSGKEAVLSDDRNSPVEAFGRVVVDV